MRTIGDYPGGTAIAGRRYRNNVLIPGATGASYTIIDADTGHNWSTRKKSKPPTPRSRKWFRSAEVTVGHDGSDHGKGTLLGTGPFALGATVTRVIGDYPGSTPIAGRRYRNNVLIPGATGASYTIDAADVGQQLVYEEDVQHNDTGTRKSFRSAPVTVAAAPVRLRIAVGPSCRRPPPSTRSTPSSTT